MPEMQYLIALGSNRRHQRHGRPRKVLRQAMVDLAATGTVTVCSKIMSSRPIGPSSRRYANAAAIVTTLFEPQELIVALKAMESAYGRRRGQKWSSRVLDLDIILWSEGIFASSSPPLVIPHPLMRDRHFVLHPATEIAPRWRDPLSGLSIRQLFARKLRARKAPEKSDFPA